MSLKEDYKNDMYEGRRKYNLIKNADETVSLDDVTQYIQEGDSFTASDINATNKTVNNLDKQLKTYMDKTDTEIEDIRTVKKVTVPLSGWSSEAPYTQMIAVDGISNKDFPIVSLYIPNGDNVADNTLMKRSFGYVDNIVTNVGKISLYCYEKKPTITFRIMIKGR